MKTLVDAVKIVSFVVVVLALNVLLLPYLMSAKDTYYNLAGIGLLAVEIVIAVTYITTKLKEVVEEENKF